MTYLQNKSHSDIYFLMANYPNEMVIINCLYDFFTSSTYKNEITFVDGVYLIEVINTHNFTWKYYTALFTSHIILLIKEL